MTWLPRTLFGRNVLLMVVLITVGQLASGVAFRHYVQRPRVTQLASITSLYVSAWHATQSSQSTEQHQRLLERMSRFGRVRALSDGSQPVFAVPRVPAVRDFLKLLETQLAADPLTGADKVYWSVRPPSVWIQVNGAGPSSWLVFTTERFELEPSWMWLVLPWIVGLLAVIGASVIQRRINQPLTQLARAAEQLGKGDSPPRLPTDGPTEIAAVAQSFNRMAASLQGMERDRALILAGVSHDVRTPLTKLRLAAAMLDDNRADDRAVDADLHRGMVTAIEEIDVIVGQFLDYARSGDGEAATRGDLGALLHTIVGEFAAQGHAFEVEIAELPPIAFRPIALRRLIANLMHNAVRHGSDAGRTVCATREGAAIVVRVLDRGPGIPADQTESALRPFGRLDAAKRKAGSGLGLAIAERIVKLHGGELQLLPRNGGGLEVRVTLPMP